MNYEDTVGHCRQMLRYFDTKLNDEKRGIGSMKNDGNIAYQLKWNAEDWLRDEARCWWIHNLAAWLGHIAHEFTTQHILGINEKYETEWFDAEMSKARIKIGAECLRAVLRGELSHSNPLSMMEERAKLEAAAWALENVVGISQWQLSNESALEDVFAGIERRKEEAEAARAKVPTRVIYKKVAGGEYLGECHNHQGKELRSINFGTSNKMVARAAARSWAECIREEENCRDLIVEEVK